MSKKKIAITALALAAIVAVGGGTYAVSGFTDHSMAAPAATQSTVSKAETTAASKATSSATDPQQTEELRTQILDMLKDHMGITGSEADKLATTMAELMQKNGNTNAADMVKQCAETAGQMMGNSQMMGGGQMMDAGGMMNDVSPSTSGTTDSTSSTSAHESHHPSGS